MVLREAVLQCATSHNVNLGATISWVARIIELSEIRPITICHHLSCSVGLGVEYESLDPGQKYVCECKKKDLSEAGQRADDRSGTFSRNGRARGKRVVNISALVWLTLRVPLADPPLSLVPPPHASYMPCRRRPTLSGTPRCSSHESPNQPIPAL